MPATAKLVEVGAIVHYVLPNGPNRGAHRPAVVVGVKNEYTVDLQVFSDGTKSAGDCAPNVFWKPNCLQDESGHSEETWHIAEDSR